MPGHDHKKPGGDPLRLCASAVKRLDHKRGDRPMIESPTRLAELRWEGGMRFRGGEIEGPNPLLDADGVEAPGPFIALLLAAGACAASDVVLILGKSRVD